MPCTDAPRNALSELKRVNAEQSAQMPLVVQARNADSTHASANDVDIPA